MSSCAFVDCLRSAEEVEAVDLLAHLLGHSRSDAGSGLTRKVSATRYHHDCKMAVIVVLKEFLLMAATC